MQRNLFYLSQSFTDMQKNATNSMKKKKISNFIENVYHVVFLIEPNDMYIIALYCSKIKQ